MSVISMKQLLEAGVHFGHQTRRWNPKMAPYIYTERNGIYIIDLQKTAKKVEEAYSFVRDIAAEGGEVLFVGTKKQAQESIKEEAERVGMYYVNARWLGGMLTNFETIKKRIERLKQIKKMEEDGVFELLPKKEVQNLKNEVEKLEKMTADERFAFWQNELSKCIRCNACRDVCPACTCEKCVFGNPNSGVENKAAANSFEERMFHIIRAFHVCGRCTDCGECSRVCPQNIPLHLLNRKFIKDMNEFYGEYQAGAEVGSRAPLVDYTIEDLEPGEVFDRRDIDA